MYISAWMLIVGAFCKLAIFQLLLLLFCVQLHFTISNGCALLIYSAACISRRLKWEPDEQANKRKQERRQPMRFSWKWRWFICSYEGALEKFSQNSKAYAIYKQKRSNRKAKNNSCSNIKILSSQEFYCAHYSDSFWSSLINSCQYTV